VSRETQINRHENLQFHMEQISESPSTECTLLNILVSHTFCKSRNQLQIPDFVDWCIYV